MNNYNTARKKRSFEIFNEIASTYDLLNRGLSVGIDVYWRKKLLKETANKQNQEVLDIATGTGDTAILLAKQSNIKSVVGVDLSEEMLKIAQKKIQKENLTSKINLKTGDGVSLQFADNSFDTITITFGIRNFYNPSQSLKEIYRVLKPGGKLLIIEFGKPQNKIINYVFQVYFTYILPWIGNLISKHGDAYTYLNKTVNDFPYGNNFTKMMKDANFTKINYKLLSFGISYLYTGEKN